MCTERYEVICLTETHLTSKIKDNEINTEGYKPVRCGSISPHTGGVIFYVREYWRIEILENISVGMESWWLVIRLIYREHVLVLTGLYRSPSPAEARFCDNFREYLNRMPMNENKIIIV